MPASGVSEGESPATPRWEFRVFGRGPAERLAARLARRLAFTGFDAGWSLYLLPRDRPALNLKLRDGRLEMKTRITARDGLQRWRPSWSAALPVPPSAAPMPVAALGGALERPAGLVHGAAPAGWLRFHVHRRRWRHAGGELLAEVTRLRINGQRCVSVCIESPDPGAVAALRDRLRLAGCINHAYPEWLARIAGLLPLSPRSGAAADAAALGIVAEGVPDGR